MPKMSPVSSLIHVQPIDVQGMVAEVSAQQLHHGVVDALVEHQRVVGRAELVTAPASTTMAPMLGSSSGIEVICSTTSISHPLA
jgi:hypothetical protein